MGWGAHPVGAGGPRVALWGGRRGEVLLCSVLLAQGSGCVSERHLTARPAALGRREPAGGECPAPEPPLLAQPVPAGSAGGQNWKGSSARGQDHIHPPPGLGSSAPKVPSIRQALQPAAGRVARGCCQHPRLSQSMLPAAGAAASTQGRVLSSRGPAPTACPSPSNLLPQTHQPCRQRVGAAALPGDPTTRTRGLQTRVGFIHGHGGSCVTGSCPRIAHPATGARGYPCHVTTQHRHYATSAGEGGGARAPSPPSRLGSGLGRPGLTKAKDPSTHRERYIYKKKNSSTTTRAEPRGHACKRNVQQPASRSTCFVQTRTRREQPGLWRWEGHRAINPGSAGTHARTHARTPAPAGSAHGSGTRRGSGAWTQRVSHC